MGNNIFDSWITPSFIGAMPEHGRELTDEQCVAAVNIDFDRKPKELLAEIYKEATNENQTPEARIAKTMAKASTLFARLSADLERIHLSIRNLTWALLILTVVLLGYTVFLYKDTHALAHHEQTAGPNKIKPP